MSETSQDSPVAGLLRSDEESRRAGAGLFRRLKRVLSVHLWGLRSDARVDPAGFPDDEYPVACPQCGYSLRGLSAGRCPECGRAFERGRLLLAQYARGDVPRGHPAQRRVRRLIGVGLVAMCIPVLIPIGVPIAAWIWPDATWRTFSLERWQTMIVALVLIGPFNPLFLLACILFVAANAVLERARPPKQKRRRVRAAARRGRASSAPAGMSPSSSAAGGSALP